MPHARCVVVLLVLALASTCFTGYASNRSFTTVVRGLEREYQFKHKKVPGLWLAKCVLKVAHPRGVSKLQFALFENDCLRLAASPDFEARILRMLGKGWRPFVQVDAPKRHERTLLFARPDGRHLEIFVLSLEAEDSVALFARVHPDSMQRLMENPRGVASGG